MSENRTHRAALQELARRDVGHVVWNALLRTHSYWQIGGPADLLIEPGSIEQVQNVVYAIHELGLPSVVVGDGSNLLFDDRGVRGVVVKIGRRLSRVTVDGATVTAEGGVFVPRLVRLLGTSGLTGLEHAIGIPGTLGGLILMNGGSMRNGVGTVVDRVWTVNSEAQIVTFSAEDCQFSYRHSALQNARVILVKARLQCGRGEPKAIRAQMLEISRSRRCKFPLDQPSCGSVFLSDPAMYDFVGAPGQVIEEAGLKGMRIGGAMISPKHANFIVNADSASARDVLRLIRLTRERVHERTGFWLNCEVRYVSTTGEIQPAHRCL